MTSGHNTGAESGSASDAGAHLDSGAHSGMNAGRFRIPNPALHRTSTVLFDSLAHLHEVQRTEAGGGAASQYATFGTPTTAALATLVAEREQGVGTVFAPSGLGAVSLGLLAVLRSGDHLLMVDSCYGPTRGLERRYAGHSSPAREITQRVALRHSAPQENLVIRRQRIDADPHLRHGVGE